MLSVCKLAKRGFPAFHWWAFFTRDHYHNKNHPSCLQPWPSCLSVSVLISTIICFHFPVGKCNLLSYHFHSLSRNVCQIGPLHLFLLSMCLILTGGFMVSSVLSTMPYMHLQSNLIIFLGNPPLLFWPNTSDTSLSHYYAEKCCQWGDKYCFVSLDFCNHPVHLFLHP